ncbi:uncharacterized protein THITE_2126433 [Thermothielavioides terrestris NRRL 8126]|uniref:Uncharacterized protein n=1 Tax=Thermothielavioides terrestris (strain ATCC 38088 / NRRL 8126) TaxID=578455 RepID=G2QXK0_THETT|nr:uncharacterized protein THITE_2126433 [Thermothielavioides terrestris NRRL 8126]AEO64025.1 hypothetical protein THITE_2126433 [Thermothielavioides terrestris NRRL 8126]
MGHRIHDVHAPLQLETGLRSPACGYATLDPENNGRTSLASAATGGGDSAVLRHRLGNSPSRKQDPSISTAAGRATRRTSSVPSTSRQVLRDPFTRASLRVRVRTRGIANLKQCGDPLSDAAAQRGVGLCLQTQPPVAAKRSEVQYHYFR